MKFILLIGFMLDQKMEKKFCLNDGIYYAIHPVYRLYAASDGEITKFKLDIHLWKEIRVLIQDMCNVELEC